MASIKVTTAGYEAELDIPDDDQVMDALRYQTMLLTATDAFQHTADLTANPGQPATDRNNQLTALAALQAAILAARDAALPTLELTPD